ncbi:MAG TPA: VOC family protein [Casimicrobiaceae bacterium]|nr:VOC family protein [Casimicrobiaceae bacterium]
MSDANSMNRAVWLDIPVADLDRAIAFYAAVLGIEVHREKFENVEFAVLAHDGGNGGCLVVDPGAVTRGGILVYFNTEGRIRDAVGEVERHGGQVLRDTHSIGPHGYRAIVLDSEGNRIALHSGT